MLVPKDDTRSIKTIDAELNDTISNGGGLEAFERYYAEDVVMQENDAEPTIGKSANRIREQEFFDAITDFRDAQVLATGSGENVTFSHWFFEPSEIGESGSIVRSRSALGKMERLFEKSFTTDKQFLPGSGDSNALDPAQTNCVLKCCS